MVQENGQMIAHTSQLLWDVSVYGLGERICLLALSVQGIAFVDTHRHLGESFGNGLILDETAAEAAFEDLDELNLTTRTMG